MALIVEDGTGRADAVSYATLEEAGAYHQARRNEAWMFGGVEDDFRAAALIRATQYLDGLFRTRWAGLPATIGQGLAWPRAYVMLNFRYLPSDKVPVAVVAACCEAALRELQDPGSLVPDLYPSERVVSESVGPLSVSYADTGNSDVNAPPVIVAVERLLAPLLRPAAGGALVLRA